MKVEAVPDQLSTFYTKFDSSSQALAIINPTKHTRHLGLRGRFVLGFSNPDSAVSAAGYLVNEEDGTVTGVESAESLITAVEALHRVVDTEYNGRPTYQEGEREEAQALLDLLVPVLEEDDRHRKQLEEQKAAALEEIAERERLRERDFIVEHLDPIDDYTADVWRARNEVSEMQAQGFWDKVKSYSLGGICGYIAVAAAAAVISPSNGEHLTATAQDVKDTLLIGSAAGGFVLLVSFTAGAICASLRQRVDVVKSKAFRDGGRAVARVLDEDGTAAEALKARIVAQKYPKYRQYAFSFDSDPLEDSRQPQEV